MVERKKKRRAPRSPRPASDASTITDRYGNEWAGCVPTPASEIRALEQKLQMRLPAAVATFLSETTSGRPARRLFRGGPKGVEVAVGSVLPVVSERPRILSIDRTHEVLSARADYDRALLPLAYDTGNANYFCVDLGAGAIVYWLHDDPEDPVVPLTASLDAFLSALQEVDY